MLDWTASIQPLDERRDLIVPGDRAQTVHFCLGHFLTLAKTAIAERGQFFVALSGGSTPQAIFQALAAEAQPTLDWSKVWLFWSDERSVPPNHSDSNYGNAMQALATLPIPEKQIFRMHAEGDIEAEALNYEQAIIAHVPDQRFDLTMLGMGEDGHTASLFPRTHGLHTHARLAIANYIPSKHTWRMTLTFDCINHSRSIALYVLGASKASMVKRVLTGSYQPDEFPVQRIGTPTHKALWILDKEAAADLAPPLNGSR